MSMKILFVVVCAFAVNCTLRATELGKPVPRVSVVFVDADKFTECREEYMDARHTREHILAEIQGEFAKLALRYVMEGQHLEIKVTDVDLAGEFEPPAQL
jgi:hypothetical protein